MSGFAALMCQIHNSVLFFFHLKKNPESLVLFCQYPKQNLRVRAVELITICQRRFKFQTKFCVEKKNKLLF